MKVIHTISNLRSELNGKQTVGFVPTMGAFHQGHLELMKAAKSENDIAIVSLFVNPTQFAPNEDLSKYPRNLDQDSTLATEVGVDILFIPAAEEIYTNEYVYVGVEKIASDWEGAIRPTHFRGVATVVAKLFNIVGPCRGYFGLKDLQQCAVVRALVNELFFPVELRFIETVREPSGLALSSRNAYLSDSERQQAAALYRELIACRDAINSGKYTPVIAIEKAAKALEAIGFNVDYLSLVNPISMLQVLTPSKDSRIVAAARLSSVRLLDNVSLTISK